MRFLDKTKGQELDFTGSPNLNVISDQIKSGQYIPDTSSTYQIKTPDGQRIDVGGAELPSYLQTGSSFYTADDARKEAEQREFTSTTEQFKTAAESALSGATFGLSDVALQKTGLVDPQRAALREQYNPEIATAGEIAGAIAPIALTGGTGAIAKGASLTPTALATAAGEAAGSSLTQFATRGVTSPIAKKLAESAVKTGAGSAIESALYGVGKGVSEAALGKPEATAENILADIGTNTVLGGLLGGALGAGVTGAGLVAKKGTEKINKVIGDLGSSKEQTKYILRDLGGNKTQVKNILGNDYKSDVIRDVYKYALQTDTPAFQGDLIDDFMKSDKKLSMDSIGVSDDVLTDRVGVLKERAGQEIESLVTGAQGSTKPNNIIKYYESLGSDISSLNKADKAKFNEFVDTLKERFDNYPDEISPAELWEFRKEIDQLVFNNQTQTFAGPKDNPFTDTLRKLRKEAEALIEKDIEGAGLIERYKAAKQIYSGAADTEKLLFNKLGKEANNAISLTDTIAGVGAGAGALAGGLGGLASAGLAAAGAATRKVGREYGDRGMLLLLDKLEKKNLSIGKLSDEAINSFLKVARKPITVSELAGSREDKNKTYEEKLEGFTSQVNQIEEIKKNLDESLAPMGLAAPDTAIALRDKTLNALDFLASKLPKAKSGVLREYKPSEGEIDRFNRYAVAIDNPKTIMKNLSSGYISPEEVEVLKKVYPEIHSQLKEKAIEKLTDKQRSIPYQLRIQLQKLLDVKEDVNLQYQYTQALQKSFAPGGALSEEQMQPKMATGRAKNTSFSQNQLSGYQSIINRS